MNSSSRPAASTRFTRRQLVSGVLVGCATQVLTSAALGQSQDKTMSTLPASDANKSRTSLHQEIDYKGSPQRIYEVLLSSKDFTAFSGYSAEIDPKVGGAFSMFGGLVVGRNVELVPSQRIVQAWRLSKEFPDGVYSLVKMDLQAKDSQTRIILDHTGFPEGHFDHLDTGWYSHYWEPLKKFLA
jgi:activator of HSP90 ATPase